MSAAPIDVVRTLVERQEAGDDAAIDEVVAPDLVNHAAGPQGAAGLKAILAMIDHDLGPVTLEQHHLIAEGELVTQHLTMVGTHRASTMPLLTGVPVEGRPVRWEFIHIWRVADGMIVEHWATRDDLGLLVQLGAH